MGCNMPIRALPCLAALLLALWALPIAAGEQGPANKLWPADGGKLRRLVCEVREPAGLSGACVQEAAAWQPARRG